MPYRPIKRKFYYGNGDVFSRYEERLDEPPSGEAAGTVLDLAYTPAGSETLFAAQVGGPTGRCRVDISTDGGSNWSPATNIAVSGAFKLRAVALPFGDDDSDACSWTLVAVGDGGEANWQG